MRGKFIISYLLVLLLPVVVILAYYYPNSTRVANEKEMEWNAHVTEQFMNSMDIFTRYVYHLPSELTQNRELKLYMAEEDDYQRYIIANEMRKYNATDAFIYNTLLYVKSIGYWFAKTGSAYTKADFARPGVGFYYTQWPHERMFEQLDGLTKPTVRAVEDVIVPGSNRLRMLTFLLPLPLGGSHSPGVVMILVKEQTIVGLMRSVSDSYTGEFFIFDEQGNRLIASGDAGYADTDGFREMLRRRLSGNRPGSGIERMDGQAYIVTHAISDANGWHYVSMLPLTQAQQDIRAIQRNTIVIGGLLLLLEFLVIYISIRKNYHPIKRLVHFAAGIFAPPQPRKLGEIDTIRYALDRLSSDNSRLDERVKRSLPIMRDNVLFGLVSGQYADWDACRHELETSGLKFGHSHATVAVLLCDADEDEAVDDALDWCRRKEGDMPAGLRAYFFRSVYHHEIVAVFSHDEAVSPRPQLEQLRQALTAQTGARVRIGIGKAESAHAPEGIQYSYLQAVRTAEHLPLRAAGDMLAFEEIDVPQQGAVSHSAEWLRTLEMSILKHDVAAVRAVMGRVIAYFEQDAMPPHMARTIYLNTVSVIMNGFQRFHHDDRTLLQLTEAAIHHRHTMAQMIGIMRESGEKLCAMIQSALPAVQPASADEMLAYVEQHGLSPDFSLQMMADRFGMSLSNFSYHFKKTVGQNFKEHVDRARIHRSIQLLQETCDPLETIARQVGYANTSSFIRCFKKIVGMTPGQFRDSCPSQEA